MCFCSIQAGGCAKNKVSMEPMYLRTKQEKDLHQYLFVNRRGSGIAKTQRDVVFADKQQFPATKGLCRAIRWARIASLHEYRGHFAWRYERRIPHMVIADPGEKQDLLWLVDDLTTWNNIS